MGVPGRPCQESTEAHAVNRESRDASLSNHENQHDNKQGHERNACARDHFAPKLDSCLRGTRAHYLFDTLPDASFSIFIPETEM